MITTRLIQSGYCDAATNMAIDEAIFLSYQEGLSEPTLRLYGWKPAAISLGHSQNAEMLIDLSACAKEGIDVVRRPTGGGIIFHANELTYSIVLSQSDIGLSYRVKESFEAITSFLLACYRGLGAEANFTKDIAKGPFLAHSIAPFCFSRNEEYDIMVNNRKCGGNAQKRKKNVILQHGSIPLSFDKARASRFLNDPLILKNLDVTTIHEFSKEKMDFQKLSEALMKSFSFHFKTILKTGRLSLHEEKLAQELNTAKYSTPEWNFYAQRTPARVA